MRKQLSKSDKDSLNTQLKELYDLKDFVGRKQPAELIKDDGLEYVVLDNKALFFYHGHKPVPTLKLLLEQNILPTVTVDMGAVKFVTNGADIMRPGVTKFSDGLKKGRAVCIIDETHGKALGVGVMLMDGQTAREASSGKVIKNIHWVGDKLWQV